MHDLTLSARFADRVVCLFDGKIVADGPSLSTINSTLIQNVYAVKADVDISKAGHRTITPLQAIGTIKEETYGA